LFRHSIINPHSSMRRFPHQKVKGMNKVLIIIFSLLAGVYPKSTDLILKSANSDVNTMSKDGEMISTLTGNVVFLYDDAVIKSEYARWMKSRGVVSFSDRVSVTRPNQKITSDRMDYDKNKSGLSPTAMLISMMSKSA